MKIKKEILCALIIFIITFGLCACFGGNEEIDSDVSSISQIADVKEEPQLSTHVDSEVSKSESSEINSQKEAESVIREEVSESVPETVSESESEIESESVSTAETEREPLSEPETQSEIEIIENSDETAEISVNAEAEMRGVWINYLSLSSGSESEFKTKFTSLAQKAKDRGITDLFVHVRPFMDSMYKSENFPISHIITGTQGADISFDALKFMIEVTHGMGMKFHAWINPLRIKTSATPKVMSEDNVYNKYIESDPYFFIESDSGIILNPAYSFTRELASDGIREIVANYDVDGIHFDDYFYPENYDAENDGAYLNYKENTENPLSGNQWMQANINSLISICYQAAKSSGKEVLFGISPQGNIDNNLKIGANTTLWCETKGYIDYICPQIYWSYDNPALGFSEALETWMSINHHDELDVYIGLALYKIGTDSDSNTWGDGALIIERQEKDAVTSGAQGFLYYEISHFDKLN